MPNINLHCNQFNMIRIIKRHHFTFPIPKELNEVARVPLLRQESPPRIRQLWLDQFKRRPDVIVGTLSESEYQIFKANATACPMFLINVSKGSDAAYFNLVSQFQDGKHCLMTSVDAFRVNQQNAAPMIVSTIYDELVQEKGIALLRADIINRVDITRDDALHAVKFLRSAYVNRFELVKRFNADPRSFDYNEFMQYNTQFRNEASGVSNSL